MSGVYLNLSTSNDNVEPLREARLHLEGMRRFPTVPARLSRVAAALILVAGAAACDDEGPTAPSTETPVTQNIVETFSGLLGPNGAVTFPFAVAASGTVTAQITAVAPDNTVAVGFTLGTWSGTQCAAVISNDNAIEFTQLVGSAGSSGSLCLRIHDVGRLSSNLQFTMKVTHP